MFNADLGLVNSRRIYRYEIIFKSRSISEINRYKGNVVQVKSIIRRQSSAENRSSSRQNLFNLNLNMNLLCLFNFVLRQAAFGLVIGSPNLPVLDNGDVSGKFETMNLCSSTYRLERFSSTISNYKIFSWQWTCNNADYTSWRRRESWSRVENRGLFLIVHDPSRLITKFRTQSIAIDASILDIQRKLNNLDLLITLVSGK